MFNIKGKAVATGIAHGRIRVLERDNGVEERKVEDRDGEKLRLDIALQQSKEQLEVLQQKTKEGAIFEAHAMMLEDPELLGTIDSYLDKGYEVAYAVFRAKDDLKDIFLSMEDEYFRARAADVEDVMTRLIHNLQGKNVEHGEEDFILVADELYPSETLEMDFHHLKGIATLRGSVTSHTTILANNLKIPALISLEIGDIHALDGKEAIIDGTTGELLIEPDISTVRSYDEKREAQKQREWELRQYIDMQSMTEKGQSMEVYANIGSDIEAEAAFEQGAAGIGLFRSEFLFLGRSSAPDEDEQYRAYKNALNFMNGRPVIIRTLDLGADKQVDYLDLKPEDNPQMGLRAIRISLTHPDLFKTQLRALLRAAIHGPLKIMLPMIISVKEIRETKEILSQCRKELTEANIPHGKVELGIMIETPAAAVDAENLAKEVDFFSIGTNDLVSYTLALDRTNTELDSMRDNYHPAVLKLIEMTAKAAKKAGIPVGICGAMGGDLSLTDFYLSLGIDELSVAVRQILPTKEKIINS